MNSVSWGPFEGPLFLELDCSESSGMDLRWMKSYVSNINKIRQTVQPLAMCTSVQIDRRDSENHLFTFTGAENF
jgi:hypothetical protein